MKLKIFDTTLRDGEQTPGVHFGVQKKIDIAKRLAALRADVIEAGFPASSRGESEAVSAIASTPLSLTVAALARLTVADVDAAAASLASSHPSNRKRLHLFIATSDTHLENKLRMTREDVLARIPTVIGHAVALGIFDEIEFSAEDATRTDPEYLCEVFALAKESGAGILNIPDTVGYATPGEFASLVRRVSAAVGVGAEISVHCHNDLGLAVANSLAAISAGATQVECTVNGLGERAGNAALEEIVMAISVRGDSIRVPSGELPECGVITREINETSRFVSSLSGVAIAAGKPIVGANAFSHASGIHQHGIMAARETYEIMAPESVGLESNTIVLGKLSGRHAFCERVESMGYTLDERGLEASFARFKEIAEKKSVITNEDIRAIVGEYLDSVEGRYYLSSFQIQSGNHIKAMALVTLEDRELGELVTEAAPGEGPIDAAFNAIGRIAGIEIKLESYGISAVTEGADALGEAKVKISTRGTQHTGRGVSTDIIKASIKAYLNAVNKARNSE